MTWTSDPDDLAVVVRLPHKMATDFACFLRSRGLEGVAQTDASVPSDIPNTIGYKRMKTLPDPLILVTVPASERQQAVVLYEQWTKELEKPLEPFVKKFRRDIALVIAGSSVLGAVLWFVGEDWAFVLIYTLLIAAGLAIIYITFRSKNST